MNNKIVIGVSSCLIGEPVRYDGGHRYNRYISEMLCQHFELKPFCPEVSIGLGVPRETIHLIASDKGVRCVGTQNPELDVTQQLQECADEQLNWHNQISGYIFKKNSPSCGMVNVKLYKNGAIENSGVGIYAEQLMKNCPNLPTEDEDRLGDSVLSENFSQRVCIYHHWQLLSRKLSWRALDDFHTQYKSIMLSHDKNTAQDLGRDLSKAGHTDNPYELRAFSEEYIQRLMRLLNISATRDNI